jgi:hypothetical protein
VRNTAGPQRGTHLTIGHSYQNRTTFLGRAASNLGLKKRVNVNNAECVLPPLPEGARADDDHQAATLQLVPGAIRGSDPRAEWQPTHLNGCVIVEADRRRRPEPVAILSSRSPRPSALPPSSHVPPASFVSHLSVRLTHALFNYALPPPRRCVGGCGKAVQSSPLPPRLWARLAHPRGSVLWLPSNSRSVDLYG